MCIGLCLQAVAGVVAKDSVPAVFHSIYSAAWMVGFGIAVATYLLCMNLFYGGDGSRRVNRVAALQ